MPVADVKEYRDRLFLAGLCRTCAKRPLSKTSQECLECREKHNARRRLLWRTSPKYRQDMKTRRDAHRNRELTK